MGRIAKLTAWSFLFAAMAIGSSTWAAPQNTSDQAPDNTGINKRDRNNASPTADSQKDNPSDRDTAQQIRKAITNDKSLSSYARNVKVIVQGGEITLKGPVRSEEEKKAIEEKATEVAGKQHRIMNEIEVKPDQK